MLAALMAVRLDEPLAEKMVAWKADHWVAWLDARMVALMAVHSAEKKAVHLVWQTAALWVVETGLNLVARMVERTAKCSVDVKAVRKASRRAAWLVAPTVADLGAKKAATMVGLKAACWVDSLVA